MKKYLIYTLIVISCSLSITFAQINTNFLSWNEINDELIFSWTNNPTSTAIWEFINREKEIINQIYENSNLMVLIDLDSAKKQIKNLTNQLYQLSEEFQQVKKRREKIHKNYYEILSWVKLIIDDIKKTNQSISLRMTRIAIYSNRISKLQKEIEDIKQDIELTKNAFVKYTKMLYKLSNEIYTKDLEIDIIRLLFKNQENISMTLSKEDLLKMLNVKLNKLIDLLEKKQKKLNYTIEKLDYLKNKYATELEYYNKELDMLKQQRKYLIKLLKILKLDKKEFDEKYNNLFYSKTLLHKQILALTHSAAKKVKKQITDENIKKLLEEPDKDPTAENFFSWPIRKIDKIITYFNDEEYEKKYWAPHLAIDIRAAQWTTVYAPANWIVYKIVDQDGPGLNWMIIVHKNGYISVYLHLNKIFVKEGQFVKRWQPIAKSWWKPWTRWAGLLTSWPHLHFEIIKNWQHIDPLTVLDLSLINFDFKNLKKTYRLKYVKDKLEKNIDLSDIKPMKWDTIEERRLAFLQTYGVWPFRSIDLWKTAAKDQKIDIDLGICIAFAETSLWKNFARNSKWNVGNVWNNDRWDRVSFPTPIAGAKAIYSTLNNKYLRNIYTLNMLSRYWSKDGPIYASDSKHWQKNVMKCLKMIKGYPIPEDYFFREF